MRNIEISSGRLTALARLLKFLHLHPGIDSSGAIEHLVKTRQIQTRPLADDAEEFAFELGLLERTADGRKLTQAGTSIVIGYNDDYGLAIQRRLLLKMIVSVRRDLLWITFAQPEELRKNLPALFQILLELKLLERKPGAEAAEFWSELQQAQSKMNNAVLKRIGDEAEGWSMVFERERLITSGLSELGEEIVWVSRESDLHGYDILSFSGHEPAPAARRHIEVKRAKLSRPGFVTFHFSRNEFQSALALSENYFLHVWWKVPSALEANLSVVPGLLVTPLAPQDHDEDNRWSDCIIGFDVAKAEETHLGAAKFDL